MATKNTLTHVDMLKASNHIQHHIPEIEKMQSFQELAGFLAEKMGREISVHNAKSIFTAVTELGIKINAFGQQKPEELASEDVMLELIRTNKNLMKAVYALIDAIKKQPGNRTLFPDKEEAPVV